VIKRISRVEKDRALMLLQVATVSAVGAVVGCIAGYYLLF
jgi:hypothetical protein